VDFEPLTAGFYVPGKKMRCRPRAVPARSIGFAHDRVFPENFCAPHLADCDGALHPLVEGFMQGGSRCSGVGENSSDSRPEQEQLVCAVVSNIRLLSRAAARGCGFRARSCKLMGRSFFFEAAA